MTPHVVIDPLAPVGQLALLCTRCGGRLSLALPVSVDEMVSANEAFAARHRECRP